MSRIGRKPVNLPDKVKATVSGTKIQIEGPKGKLEFDFGNRIKVKVENNEVTFERPTNINTDRAMHGLTRSLVANMVRGVSEGYEKQLKLEGVGYKAAVKGKVLDLSLGYTHAIEYNIPEGIEVKCQGQNIINISGIDKQLVGQAAADIRAYHKPEPYKGKGVAYSDERIRRKQGKTVG